uniref:NADH-ubiquinone oxidoreductase chain 4L n=1 Tax=Tetragnatha nitens TaxID=545214 RepID=A0A0N7BW88_9ARAC|nr:NADH dehydrogenase subunit 4L [Tetragnatha nitens]AKG65089.1 NADH dehydrogenase subunit 4L [Tetragnatha nitens]
MLMKTLFMISLMCFMWWRKNIIMILLSMEMILTILFISISSTAYMNLSLNSMFMLIMMVVGSSIGISLMVAISRLQNSINSTTIWTLTFVENYNNNSFYSTYQK